ncbi:Signal transduction histidine kinase [Reichenbachiella faecimaris]|uniref:histidine kinase n=1 Tax=Reichenbachiella faecimaris TaxID=692418 RepID=A0A1W2G876_REIFA|nr:response regulator [Reichenbachiella faecimaris]SMD32811.1 Signal transduction histidine kinase [Reichenbachiella faecimaris]
MKRSLILNGWIALLCLWTNASLAETVQSKKSIDSLKDSLHISSGVERAEILAQLSWQYRNVNSDSALYFGKQAYELSKSYNYESGIIKSLNFQGIAYRNKSDYSNAFKFFVEALKAAEEAQNLEQIGYSNINIGNIYIYQTNYNGALEYFEKALASAQELNDQSMLAYIYLNLGRTYLRMDKYDKAELNYLKTRGIRKNLNDNEGLVTIAVDLAELAMRKGDLSRSLGYFHESIDAINQIKNKGALAFSLYNIAVIHRQQGHLDSAEYYSQESLQVAKSNNLKNDIRKIHENLSIIAEGRGDYEKALFYFKLNQENEDSIFNEQTTRTIESLKSQYEAEKKEAETMFLREIVERQQTIIILAAAASVLLLIIAIIIYMRAVERRRLNRQISAQAKKLEELDFAKSRFFANISHDLRSPLSLILGNYEQIKQDDESYLTSDSKQNLEVANKNAQRLLFLTDEINELTKLEEGKISLKLKDVPVNSYLSALVSMFKSSAEFKSVNLTYESSITDEVGISIDPNQFEKIIFNLITNALKHTHQGDSVMVKVETINHDLKIYIRDTGEGIPENSLPYLFDRYYQSPTNKYHVYEGLGIGLSLVKELIDVHGGKISVKSKIGEGSTFTLTIPFMTLEDLNPEVPETSEYIQTKNKLWSELWEKTYQEGQTVSLSANGQDSSKPKLLLVDDHPEVREFIAKLIKQDYEVTEAENGVMALKILKNQSIDLVITDLMMPWMDGFELLEKMQENEDWKSIPVLVVSARNTADDQFQVLTRGINNILQKPFGKKDILLRIKNLLNQKEKWAKEGGNTIIVNDRPLINDIEKELLEKVKKLVIEQIDNPDLTVLVLADEMAASERKVYRMIKKLTDLTPHEYIKEIRWHYLEQLIKNKSLKNPTEAAKAIGMKNVTNFKKQFHKKFNRSIEEMMAKKV